MVATVITSFARVVVLCHHAHEDPSARSAHVRDPAGTVIVLAQLA
jgi:hypothetical protein